MQPEPSPSRTTGRSSDQRRRPRCTRSRPRPSPGRWRPRPNRRRSVDSRRDPSRRFRKPEHHRLDQAGGPRRQGQRSTARSGSGTQAQRSNTAAAPVMPATQRHHTRRDARHLWSSSARDPDGHVVVVTRWQPAAQKTAADRTSSEPSYDDHSCGVRRSAPSTRPGRRSEGDGAHRGRSARHGASPEPRSPTGCRQPGPGRLRRRSREPASCLWNPSAEAASIAQSAGRAHRQARPAHVVPAAPTARPGPKRGGRPDRPSPLWPGPATTATRRSVGPAPIRSTWPGPRGCRRPARRTPPPARRTRRRPRPSATGSGR